MDLSVEDVSGVSTELALAMEDVRGTGTAQRPKTAKHTGEPRSTGAGDADAQEWYLSRLQQQYPGLAFSTGTGFDTSDTAALADLGKGNVMLDPHMASLMAEKPGEAEKYDRAFQELMDDFDMMYSRAGGSPESLLAWGTYLNYEGLFNTWGITNPLQNNNSVFEFFDDQLFEDMTALEEKRYQEELDAEREFVKHEQEMEEAEQEFNKTHGLNPYIQQKSGAVNEAVAQYIHMAEEPKTDMAHHLDVKD